jgi:hypothetical protein
MWTNCPWAVDSDDKKTPGYQCDTLVEMIDCVGDIAGGETS